METIPFNLAVVAGHLSRPAEARELGSGAKLVALELTVPREGAPAESVPVVWHEAPAWASTLSVGEEVIVIGRVRRRFFRAGGTTQSRTEVLADQVVLSSWARRRREALGNAEVRLRELSQEG
ncbi:MAG: single-stranded DNA-binding protein [Acidimicrobiales bacterium]